MENTPQPVDQKALNLTHAIALQESSKDGKTPNYTAVGDAGTSKGAYQWQPGNFQSAAKQYGLDPNDFSPKNQDKVAYAQVKAYKDKGYQPAQIASLWNSGSPDNYENHKGTTVINGQTIAYDTPAYVQNVKKYYQQVSGGNNSTQYNPKPFSSGETPIPLSTSDSTTQSTEGDQSLGAQLNKRATDASTAVSNAFSGKINPISGVLQTVGAGAGAINDIAQKGLELIPGVKSVEGLLGKGVSKLANTGTGQSVVKGINDFTQAHPELSADIGSVGNIAGAAGLITGAGEAKDAIGGVLSKSLGRDATSVAEKELSEVATRTVTGRKLLQANPDAMKILAQPEFKPAVESIGGVNKYVTKDSASAIDSAIKDIDENKLQPLLDNNNTNSVADRIPLQTYRDAAVSQAKDALIDEGGINKLFDRIQGKYGDFPTLSQMNEAKRLVAKQITDAAFGSDTYTTSKIVRSSLQKGIEDGATKLGLGDVNTINKEMSALYKADDFLKTIDGKAVKLSKFAQLKKGLVSGAIKGVSEGLGAGALYEGYKKITGQ